MQYRRFIVICIGFTLIWGVIAYSNSGTSLRGARPELIHVMIPSFLDSYRCSITVLEAFKYAAQPEFLRFHIVDQRNLEQNDASCLGYAQLEASKFAVEWESVKRQAEEVQVDASSESCGPVPARAKLADMIQDVDAKDFVLGIDSHMHFYQDWDRNAKSDFKAIGSDLGIISAYPKAYDGVEDRTDPGSTTVFNGFFFQNDLPRMRTAHIYDKLDAPKEVIGWAAGFNFMRASAWQVAPPDPTLEQIFDGEEMHTYLRLWTRGYNTYAPTHTILSHEYNSANTTPQLSWVDNKNCDYAAGLARLKALLSGGDMSEVNLKYRLGSARSLHDFELFTKSDFNLHEPKI